MNLKNMRRLRAHLRSRKNPVGFNMANWFQHNSRDLVTPTVICRAVETHPCGTVACLAGHAALLAWQSGDIPLEHRARIRVVAAEWLGLKYDESHDLFAGNWGEQYRGLLKNLTKAQAITALTRLIDAEQAA